MNLIEFAREYKTLILVPMTLVNPVYFKEIFDALHEAEIKKTQTTDGHSGKGIVPGILFEQWMGCEGDEEKKRVVTFQHALLLQSSFPENAVQF